MDAKKAIEDLIATHRHCAYTIGDHDAALSMGKAFGIISEDDIKYALVENQFDKARELINGSINSYTIPSTWGYITHILEDIIAGSSNKFEQLSPTLNPTTFNFLTDSQTKKLVKNADFHREQEETLTLLLKSFENVSIKDTYPIIDVFTGSKNKDMSPIIRYEVPKNNLSNIFIDFATYNNYNKPNILGKECIGKYRILNNYRANIHNIAHLSAIIFNINLHLPKFLININTKLFKKKLKEEDEELKERLYHGLEYSFIRSKNIRTLAENTKTRGNLKAICRNLEDYFEDELCEDEAEISPRLEFLLLNEHFCWTNILKQDPVDEMPELYPTSSKRIKEFLKKNKIYDLIHKSNDLVAKINKPSINKKSDKTLLYDVYISRIKDTIFKKDHIALDKLIPTNYMFFFNDPYVYDPNTEWIPNNILNKFRINLAYAHLKNIHTSGPYYNETSKDKALELITSIKNPDLRTNLNRLKLLYEYWGWFSNRGLKKEIIESIDEQRINIRTYPGKKNDVSFKPLIPEDKKTYDFIKNDYTFQLMLI